jgi:hypothetical protein
MRDPATALLAAGALAFVSAVFFAETLTPKAGSPPGSGSDLALSFRTPAGATLAEAAAQLEPLERALAREPRIASQWTDFDAFQARIELRLTPEASAGAERERLIAALRLSPPALRPSASKGRARAP